LSTNRPTFEENNDQVEQTKITTKKQLMRNMQRKGKRKRQGICQIQTTVEEKGENLIDEWSQIETFEV